MSGNLQNIKNSSLILDAFWKEEYGAISFKTVSSDLSPVKFWSRIPLIKKLRFPY